MSSYPNRTSPVVRGKWLLDTILGAPPPAPPPNVPTLPEEPFNGGKTVSVRERLEQHRSNAVCASCHQTIDPLGFALENFDALGAWRTVDEGGNPVDAGGTMPNGVRVDGLPGPAGPVAQSARTVCRYRDGKALGIRPRAGGRVLRSADGAKDHPGCVGW